MELKLISLLYAFSINLAVSYENNFYSSLVWTYDSISGYLQSNYNHVTREEFISIDSPMDLRIKTLGLSSDYEIEIVISIVVKQFFDPIIVKVQDFEYLASCQPTDITGHNFYIVKFDIL